MTHQLVTPKNIFLVGPMGAGKTTVGKQLAKALRYDFIDSDHEIERRTGAGIPLIFDIEGEEGFRRWEKVVIDDLTQRRSLVLATGGGAVLDEGNRSLLRQRGVVVYLRATADQLYQRTAKDRNRPLLQTKNPRAKIQELIAARDPLYRDVADITVDTGPGSVRNVVNQITAHLRRLGMMATDKND